MWYLCGGNCTSCSGVTPEHQRCAPKEEFLFTDVAYCEQAVIFLKQAKLPQNSSQSRKEDGTLPVSKHENTNVRSQDDGEFHRNKNLKSNIYI